MYFVILFQVSFEFPSWKWVSYVPIVDIYLLKQIFSNERKNSCVSYIIIFAFQKSPPPLPFDDTCNNTKKLIPKYSFIFENFYKKWLYYNGFCDVFTNPGVNPSKASKNWVTRFDNCGSIGCPFSTAFTICSLTPVKLCTMSAMNNVKMPLKSYKHNPRFVTCKMRKLRRVLSNFWVNICWFYLLGKLMEYYESFVAFLIDSCVKKKTIFY